MAGMFIEGMAGIENTARTSASGTGEPSVPVTITTTVFLPALGGFGSVATSIEMPPETASVFDAAAGSAERLPDD
jgi:hypothetical protein